uniref:Cytochrome c oxidase subunit 4 n=1 Tax=Scolopendra viridis TaxID=118503 RepID=A0A4D5R9A3_SCOVI
MATNLIRLRTLAQKFPQGIVIHQAKFHNRAKIGKREIVGFGYNGEANYADRVDFPMPAVRFREDNAEITALRQKERGDWKNLTIEEKKALYRASFCQTFAEIRAPTGEWKMIITGILIASSLAIWFYVWMMKYVYGPLPKSFKEEHVQAQLQRMIDLRVNPIEGLASKYDYENNRWK